MLLMQPAAASCSTSSRDPTMASSGCVHMERKKRTDEGLIYMIVDTVEPHIMGTPQQLTSVV